MRVRDTGGDGPPVLLLHGALVDGSFWDRVVDALGGRRCVVPTLPLGSHAEPVADRARLTPSGLVEQIADLLDELDLRDVTVVGSDTGGALAQLLVGRRPERVARLVLTPCDAFEVFPPPLFKPLFALGAAPPLLAAVLGTLRFPPARRLPIAYGWLTKRADDATLARWIAPALGSYEIVRDAAHVFRACHATELLDNAPRLTRFEGEVVVAWPPRDRAFPFDLGRRLAAQFPHARLVEVEDSYAFVPVDRPDALAPLI
jgi:pimeloyl-ACP methyl ester carboxylesterase